MFHAGLSIGEFLRTLVFASSAIEGKLGLEVWTRTVQDRSLSNGNRSSDYECG